MRHRGVFLVALLCFILMGAGCDLLDWLQPDSPILLKIEIHGVSHGTHVESYPDYALGGLEVSILVSGGNRTKGYAIAFGDGTSATSPEALPTTGYYTFEHTYTEAGSFTVTVTSGRETKTGRVVVLNDPPVIYPSWHAVPLFYRQLVRLDASPLEHGCESSTGRTESVSGIWDVNTHQGDEVLYRLTVTGPDSRGQSVSYTIWNRLGEVINGEWISVYDLSYIEVGNSGSRCSIAPPFDPYTPRGCGDDSDDPYTPPVPTGERILFVCEAIDRVTPPERAVRESWFEDYYGGGCSSTCDE
jgi:PKD repeat protein